VVSKGSVCVQINDELGHFFQTRKGLRQGDPLSPILFNLVADMLAVLIERAKSQGFIEGLVPHLVDDGFCPSCNTQMTPFCLLRTIW
jgi:retron-type reverse transcriptase